MIAIELDQTLQNLDPETAASVERLVRDALQLAEKKRERSRESHREFVRRMAGSIGCEPFERPRTRRIRKARGVVMAWLLDTNAWISFLKSGHPAGTNIAEKLAALQDTDIPCRSMMRPRGSMQP